MKYCSKCGQQIEENAQFCSHCSNTQSTQASAPQPVVPGGRHLHCPKCKSTQFSPVVETDVKSGFSVNTTASKHLGFSDTSFKSIHRDYWMCQTCGSKFRNIENLETEISTVSKSMKPCMVFCIVFVVISLLCIIADVAIGCILSVPFSILMGILHVYYKNQHQKLIAEKDYLSVHCFD